MADVAAAKAVAPHHNLLLHSKLRWRNLRVALAADRVAVHRRHAVAATNGFAMSSADRTRDVRQALLRLWPIQGQQLIYYVHETAEHARCGAKLVNAQA